MLADHASRSNFTSMMAAQHADESKGCAFCAGRFVFFGGVHFLVWTLFSLCVTAETKGFVFSNPNQEIQHLPDLLNQYASLNWHKLDHSPQFDKTLLRGLPYDNNCAFRSFVAERTKPNDRSSHELCPCFYVWMKLEGKQVQFLLKPTYRTT